MKLRLITALRNDSGEKYGNAGNQGIIREEYRRNRKEESIRGMSTDQASLQNLSAFTNSLSYNDDTKQNYGSTYQAKVKRRTNASSA
jgi:hypothetical protein